MTAAAPRIVVAVGADHHPFSRLVQWIEEFAVAEGVSCFVQHGTADAPTEVDGAPLIPHADLLELFSTSDVVVTHGGPATIMDARRCQRLPIVLPRDPALGEHIDDHQQLFAARLAADDVVVRVEGRDELHKAIRAALDDPQGVRTGADDDVALPAVAEVGRLIEQLEQAPPGWRARRRARSRRGPDAPITQPR